MTLDRPRNNGLHLVVYERIEEHGLLASKFVPWRFIVADWLQRLLVPTLLLIFLIGGTWIYRRAQARQDESSAAVARLSARQQAVLDGADYSIISTDRSGTIVSFNRTAQCMPGYSAEEVVGKATAQKFHDPEEIRRYAAELSREFGEPVEPGFEVLVAKARRGQRSRCRLAHQPSRLPDAV